MGDSPLVEATQYLHDDVVDLLLKRGADPNRGRKSASWHAPLSAAATVGSMRILRKLMEHRASFKMHDPWGPEEHEHMLRNAFCAEHTEMVEFFYNQGLLDRKCPKHLRGERLLEKWG